MWELATDVSLEEATIWRSPNRLAINQFCSLSPRPWTVHVCVWYVCRICRLDQIIGCMHACTCVCIVEGEGDLGSYQVFFCMLFLSRKINKTVFACGVIYMDDWDCKEGRFFGTDDSRAVFLQHWKDCLVPCFCRCLFSGLQHFKTVSWWRSLK